MEENIQDDVLIQSSYGAEHVAILKSLFGNYDRRVQRLLLEKKSLNQII